jgi:hypothetical protein
VNVSLRRFVAADKDAVNAIARAAFAVMASALRLYTAIGFKRDSDLPPIRGVPYGRYVLPAECIDAALAMLRTVA